MALDSTRKTRCQFWVWFFVLLSVLASPQKEAHERGLAAFRQSDFSRAAREFKTELDQLSNADRGTQTELAARELRTFALYEAGDKAGAALEYRLLCERFPAYKLDEDAVLPETIAYLTSQVPRDTSGHPLMKDSTSERTGAQIKSGTNSAEDQRWHFTYLTPLGVGQFLAGSPVRGTVFATLEVGLVAANTATFVAFQSQVDRQRTAINPGSASQWQTAANLTFIAALTTFALGALDGLLFEPAF